MCAKNPAASSTHGHTSSRGGHRRALGTEVGVSVGTQDLPTQKAGPWEMYNLRTPIIIVLFFFVKENQYVHSEIIFSVNGWISFHP